jgi:hypothetical protein
MPRLAILPRVFTGFEINHYLLRPSVFSFYSVIPDESDEYLTLLHFPLYVRFPKRSFTIISYAFCISFITHRSFVPVSIIASLNWLL